VKVYGTRFIKVYIKMTTMVKILFITPVLVSHTLVLVLYKISVI